MRIQDGLPKKFLGMSCKYGSLSRKGLPLAEEFWTGKEINLSHLMLWKIHMFLYILSTLFFQVLIETSIYNPNLWLVIMTSLWHIHMQTQFSCRHFHMKTMKNEPIQDLVVQNIWWQKRKKMMSITFFFFFQNKEKTF